jgi:hypothetical protein
MLHVHVTALFLSWVLGTPAMSSEEKHWLVDAKLALSSKKK